MLVLSPPHGFMRLGSNAGQLGKTRGPCCCSVTPRPLRSPHSGHPDRYSPTPPRLSRLPPPCSPSRAARTRAAGAQMVAIEGISVPPPMSHTSWWGHRGRHTQAAASWRQPDHRAFLLCARPLEQRGREKQQHKGEHALTMCSPKCVQGVRMRSPWADCSAIDFLNRNLWLIDKRGWTNGGNEYRIKGLNYQTCNANGPNEG
jgi:hypothetical protein